MPLYGFTKGRSDKREKRDKENKRENEKRWEGKGKKRICTQHKLRILFQNNVLQTVYRYS